jgi:hypothetical protein
MSFIAWQPDPLMEKFLEKPDQTSGESSNLDGGVDGS